MIEKEYTQKNKIIICKYHLKDKCKFGSKCNFLHIQKHEIEHTLEEVIKLRSENTSLKSEFYKMVQEKRKLNHHETRNRYSEVYRVYALEKTEKKSSYSSFFKEKTTEEKKSPLVESGIGSSESEDENQDKSTNKENLPPKTKLKNINQEIQETKLFHEEKTQSRAYTVHALRKNEKKENKLAYNSKEIEI